MKKTALASGRDIFLLLHNIRSVHNVGSMFRTADAAGVTKIYLTGYTPTPVDRFGRPVKELSKTALGGELSVEWEYFKDPNAVIRKLRKQQRPLEKPRGKPIQVIGLEQDKRSVDYKKVKVKYPVLFIVGNEVEGVSESLLHTCDVIAEIPMKGTKESLNVAVSLGIVLFRMLGI
jgi:23S rRNA (guanosine2251-2'-O)-methyltransferase